MREPHAFPDSDEAEESLIGAMLLSRQAREDARRVVTAGDFHNPELGSLFAAILDLHREGTAVDPVTVHETTGVAKSRLLTLQSDTPASANAAHYARSIVDKATCRRLLSVSTAIEEFARTQTGAEALENAKAHLARVSAPIADVDAPETIDQFVGVDELPIRWVVPDVIEEGDRILVCAGEGVGKTTVQRQVAVCVAAGLHPFTLERIEGKNVLVVDLESREDMVRRKLRPIYEAGKKMNPTWDTSRLRVLSKPGGIDLTKRGDAIWLTERIAACLPDLICFGPLYKAYTGDGGEEDNARVVAAYIDQSIEDFGSSWLIETHAPHGYDGKRNLRPFGSSLWLRWPELGIGLRRGEGGSLGIEYFRYPRDERPGWPQALRRGQTWPWEAV